MTDTTFLMSRLLDSRASSMSSWALSSLRGAECSYMLLWCLNNNRLTLTLHFGSINRKDMMEVFAVMYIVFSLKDTKYDSVHLENYQSLVTRLIAT